MRDDRAKRLEMFLEARNSPLQNYAEVFIQVSDTYDLDWTLLTAIAGQESGFGKRICNTNNAWGWGNPCWSFHSYEEAIRFIGKAIATNPVYKNYQRSHTVFSLGRRYNGGDKSAWIAGVLAFQKQIEAVTLE